MTNFVTISDLANYRLISDSVKNATMWPMCVQEAQHFDVRPWLGDALMNEIDEQLTTSPTSLSTANAALMNGGTYTVDGVNYIFQGLKACIIYYAFARFTTRAPFNYTAAGITVKDTDFSTPASDKSLQRLTTQEYLNATTLRDEVRQFLSRNSTDYPLYKGTGQTRPRTFQVIGD